MKIQLLFGMSVSLLVGSAAASQAPYQAASPVDARHSAFKQGVATDDFDRILQGQALAEGGSDRLQENRLKGKNRSAHRTLESTQSGQALASDGFERTPLGRKLAEKNGESRG